MREFAYAVPLWPVADAWARRQVYLLDRHSDTQRLYKKGIGVLTAPRMVEISLTGSLVHLEAWVRTPLPSRIMSLFLLPGEITIEGGGFRLFVPRRLGRAEVNDLLQALGQQPIT
jgi:hypothetical protein